jgi:DNA invertase Pin-like site-specific DNA recombinase
MRNQSTTPSYTVETVSAVRPPAPRRAGKKHAATERQRVIVYCRVSTREQGEEGSSLDTQQARCIAYAEERGWEVVATFREEHSGGELWERPLLTEAREIIRGGGAEVLLAYAVDRLSRRQVHLAIVVEEIESAGGRVLFVTEDFEQSAVGTFLRNAIAFAAELEREKILERTQRGLMARTEAGRLRPAGRALYGYQWRAVPEGTPADLAKKLAHAFLDLNPDTAPVVARLYREVLEGVPMRTIAANLTRAGIRTATGKGEWGNSSVRSIIKNRSYVGEGWANRTWVNGETANYDNATLLPQGTIPAIVSAADWQAAQEMLTRNQERAARNNRHPDAAMLRSYACCGHCGCAMRVQPLGNGALAYKCTHKGCAHRYHNIRVANLDAALSERIGQIISRPDLLKEAVATVHDDDPSVHDLAALRRSRDACERERANLVSSLALIGDDAGRVPVIAAMHALTRRLAALDDEERAIAHRQDAWREAESRLDDLVLVCQTAAGAWEGMTIPERRRALDALGARVIVWNKDVRPRWTLETHLPLSVPGDAPEGDIAIRGDLASACPSSAPS